MKILWSKQRLQFDRKKILSCENSKRECSFADIVPNVTITNMTNMDESMMNKSNVKETSQLLSPMEETFQKITTTSNRVKLMKATLFEDDDDEEGDEDMDFTEAPPPNVDISKIGQPRQVILESRQPRDQLIEDIASSMLGVGSGANTSRGLGGINESTTGGNNQSMTSSLLKSQYLSMVASMKATNTSMTKSSMALQPSQSSAKKSHKKLPR